MATPTDSAAPDAPTPSSIFAGVKTLVQWFSEVPTWIRGLSPSGASAYDTGWLDCTPVGAGFTGTCKARRWGMFVEVRFDFTAIPSSAANAYTSLANLPGAIPKPSTTARGAGFFGGASPASAPAYVTTGGVVSIGNTTTTARTVALGTVVYLAG